MTPRIAAYETLIRCEKESQYANIAVNTAIQKYRFDKQDRDLYTRLVYGVIEKKLTLDYLVKQYTEKSLSRLDLSVLIILRITLYQLFFLDRIPQSAAVSEGVKLASRFASRAKGYINAILRKACRETPRYPQEPAAPKSLVLSIKYSISEEIVKLLTEQYPKKIEQILDSFASIPTSSLQIHSKFSSPQDFISQYQLHATAIDPLPFAVKLKENLSVSDMPFLSDGQAFVQDIASQITTFILDPQPDDFIMDLCACPGGKTLSAANLMRSRANSLSPQGKILACDLHSSKLPLIENGASRLGFQNISTLCQDATIPLTKFQGKANRIICDVPCSGLGVINKKPEIRYKSIQEINELPKLQYSILENAASYLKPGGTLLYSTCTINYKENDEVVMKFLNDHPEFSAVDFEINGTYFSYQSQNGCLTLLPNEYHDGFFMAKLTKQ